MNKTMLGNVIERAKELKSDLHELEKDMVTQAQLKDIRTPLQESIVELKQAMQEQGKDIRRILLILSRNSEPTRTS